MVDSSTKYPNSGVNAGGVNFDLMTAPTVIIIPLWTGAKRFKLADGSEHWGIRCRRMGPAKGGNANNAGWRHPHGGSFCSPRSTHIKVMK